MTPERPLRLRWRKPFLLALATSGNVLAACQASGVGRSTAYRHRERFAVFRKRWDEALDDAVDLLESEARRRAVEGVERPVYYQGVKVDVIKEYSDSLLIFLLKAHRPEKYRDNYDLRRVVAEIENARCQS